jgi:hypothetical protein
MNPLLSQFRPDPYAQQGNAEYHYLAPISVDEGRQ